jgi:hypothetical protein
LSDSSSIQNGVKEGDALQPLLFSVALVCTIDSPSLTRRDKLNETHQLLVYADDANATGSNTMTVKVTFAGSDVGLDVNTENEVCLEEWCLLGY